MDVPYDKDQMTTARTTSGWTITAVMLVGLLAFSILISVFWVGFLGSDDALYWSGASGWLNKLPYIGRDHWALRHTLVIPIALARLIFGNSMTAMFLPTLLYTFGLIVILTYWTWRAAGSLAAAFAIAFVITDPQVIIFSSTADVDLVESFFLVAAFFTLDQAIKSLLPKPAAAQAGGSALSWLWLLLLCGILMGLAMLSRETTVFAVAAIGVLFLAGYGMHRLRYFLIGVGFFIIVGGELLYIWLMTGNPLYRYTIDVNHDSTINRWVDQGAAIPFIHPLIDPITMFLLNHNFGLISWICVPLTVWLLRKGRMGPEAKRLTVLLGVLALTWTVFAAGLWKLLPLVPRYYLLPSVIVSVLAAMALAQLWQRGRTRTVWVLGCLLVVANLVALFADNRNFMFGENVLVGMAGHEGKVIHSDKETSRRADLLLKWENTRDKVSTDAPAAGDLYFYNPARNPNIRPAASWTVVDRRIIPASGGRWLACSLPTSVVPKSMLGHLGCSQQAVTLYRVPG